MPSIISDIIISPLKILDTNGGSVFKAIKKDDIGFQDFGEAYFSSVKPGSIKGWKRHEKMILNFIVPVGSIRFIFYDNRETSKSFGKFQEEKLSIKNYCRITIPPMLWVAYQGLGNKDSFLLNVASIPHDPKEVETEPLDKFYYHW